MGAAGDLGTGPTADDLVLSDIHVGPEHGSPSSDRLAQTAYVAFLGDFVADDCDCDCHLPRNRRAGAAVGGRLGNHGDANEEDDLSPGPETSELMVISITHRMATPLADVGLQVWSGCLLLADWLLHCVYVPRKAPTLDVAVEKICNTVVQPNARFGTILELGCGTGLASIVTAAAGAQVVFATDRAEIERDVLPDGSSDDEPSSDQEDARETEQDQSESEHWRKRLRRSDDEPSPVAANLSVLDLCQKNVLANRLSDKVRVRSLDLTRTSPLWSDRESLGSNAHPFDWTEDDLRAFREDCEVIIAADVVYLNSLTFSLVQRLFQLLLKRDPDPSTSTKPLDLSGDKLRDVVRPEWSRVCFLSIELRFQFTLVEKKEIAPAWEFFLDTVAAFNADRSETDLLRLQLLVREIDADSIPQRFDYQRERQQKLFEVFLVQCGME